MPISHVMTLYALSRVLFPCLVSLVLAGCGWIPASDTRTGTSDAETTREGSTEPVAEGPITGVAGLDVSNSYKNFEIAKAHLLATLRAARSRETWVVREISARSYTDDAHIALLQMPRGQVAVSNHYDRRGEAAARMINERRLAGPRQALQALEEFSRQKLDRSVKKSTDVYGFLARASEILSRAPRESRGVIVLATDLEDMRMQEHIDVDLRGAEIVVLAFQSGPDVVYTKRLKEQWATEFRRFNASSFLVLDPTVELRAALNSN